MNESVKILGHLAIEWMASAGGGRSSVAADGPSSAREEGRREAVPSLNGALILPGSGKP